MAVNDDAKTRGPMKCFNCRSFWHFLVGIFFLLAKHNTYVDVSLICEDKQTRSWSFEKRKIKY